MIARYFRNVLSVVLATFLILGIALTVGKAFPASAKPLTPESSSYENSKINTPEMKARQEQDRTRTAIKQIAGESVPDRQQATDQEPESEGGLTQVIDTVREKLNLDELAPRKANGSGAK